MRFTINKNSCLAAGRRFSWAQGSRRGIQNHGINAARERDAAGGNRCCDAGFEEAALDCHPVSGRRDWVDCSNTDVGNHILEVAVDIRFRVVRFKW